MKTNYELAIWRCLRDAETYAFPIGAKDPFDGEIYPALNTHDWAYLGTLPKGMPVTDVVAVKGSRVRCTLAGAKCVNTADWSIA